MVKIENWMVKQGQKGSPDIIGILPPDGRFLGIECKVKRNPLSEDQERFRKACESAGGMYVVLRDSPEGLVGVVPGVV